MVLFLARVVRKSHMRGFWEELRHRNVIRVGIAYVVASWLVAQVADLAADAFIAPDWVMQMLIVLLALGFPIALDLCVGV